MAQDDSKKVNRKRWQSAVQIARGRSEDADGINQKLVLLRSTLVNDLVEQLGLRVGDALETVSDHLIGVHASRLSQSSRAIRASPEAVRLMQFEQDCPKIRRSPSNFRRPPIEEGWRSSNELRKEYKGSLSKINSKLDTLRLELITDLINQIHCDEITSLFLIETFVVGPRAQLAGGRPALFASPTAINLLESQGIFERRTHISSLSADHDSTYCPGDDLGSPSRG